MTPIVIEQVLRDRLLQLAAVTAIVGSGDAARIRAGELLEGDTLPAITIEVDSEDHEESQDLSGVGGWVTAEILITCHAVKYLAARQLHLAVLYNGTDPGTGLRNWSTSSVEVSAMNATRRMVSLNDGAGGKRVMIRGRYRVVYREPN
jgi:hypothetical protein